MISKVVAPTDAEDAAINRGIAMDPDTVELPAEHYKNARPLSALIKNSEGRPKCRWPISIEPEKRAREPGSAKGEIVEIAPDFDETPDGFLGSE